MHLPTFLTLLLLVSVVSSVSNRPINCTSVGDPHITPFPGGRTDLYSPGVQVPGDFVLALFCGTIVSESHHAYPANPAVYVNYRVAVSESGHVIVFTLPDSVTIDGAPTVITTPVTVGTLTITKGGYGYYTITGLHGYVVGQGIGGTYMNIYVTITDGCVPTGGLCGPSASTTPVGDFIKQWHEDFSNSPFNYPTQSDYDNANPTNYQTSTGNWQTEDPKLKDTATQKCAPITQGQIAQQCLALGANAQAYNQACQDDVIATQNAGFAATIVDDFNKACQALTDVRLVLPTSAASTTATGPGIQPRVPNNAASGTFTIIARDALGVQRSVGGDKFTVTSVPPAFQFAIVDGGNGLYRVTYTPKAGSYIFAVQCDGVDIIGSAFSVVIANLLQ